MSASDRAGHRPVHRALAEVVPRAGRVGSVRQTRSGTYTRIYEVVNRIPRGRVATYGQVAALAGLNGQARQVGYALHALKDDSVPWHRVVNAQGRISSRREPGCERWQRQLLEEEGIVLDSEGRICLERFRWTLVHD
ncbi:MAG: MGMT family protein [Gemmatimonadota bacterium]|nr:MAG: MGMT family protein [Gemmatimonadota bacterium]